MKHKNHICGRSRSFWEQKLLEPSGKLPPGKSLSMLFEERALDQRCAHLDKGRWQWSALHSLLQNEHKELSLTPAQVRNLDSIRKGRALFILTGQQPVLLGGAVLWLYKALTAVESCSILEKKLSRPVVPLFWIGGDDTDLRESNHFEVLESRDNASVFSLHLENSGRLIPLSSRVLGDDTDILAGNLPAYWSGETLELAERALDRNLSFTGSFKLLAQEFLGETGMLFMDGFSPDFRRLAGPMAGKVVRRWSLFEELFNKKTGELEGEGAKPQAVFKPGTVHAFILRNGMRERVLAEGDKIYTVNGIVTPEMLEPGFDIALTHDVVSRPVLIDAVFPVIGHVLGPNELGYFMQLTDVFQNFTGGAPLVHPRMAATVVSAEAVEDFRAFSLAPAQLSGLTPVELKKILRQKSWKDQFPDGETLTKIPDRFLQDLEQSQWKAFAGEKGMDDGPLKSFKREVLSLWRKYLEKLRKMNYQKDAHRFSHLFRHLKWLANGTGQDRHLNVFSLVELLGRDGVKELIEVLKPLELEHQVVEVEEDS